jgi:hypothetical protein
VVVVVIVLSLSVGESWVLDAPPIEQADSNEVTSSKPILVFIVVSE